MPLFLVPFVCCDCLLRHVAEYFSGDQIMCVRGSHVYMFTYVVDMYREVFCHGLEKKLGLLSCTVSVSHKSKAVAYSQPCLHDLWVYQVGRDPSEYHDI